ncbi:MAG: RidA family protein [Gemmatimonadota bacterium]|nr:RidA family protein [bacterium]MDE2874503.1 RidA family protein [Gemmatimonadota bacterium]
MKYEIVNPEALGSPRGWNNGMLAPEGGRVLFVAGQIGVVGEQEGPPGARGAGSAVGAQLAAQFQAALANVARVVEAAGGTVADVGRLTIYVTDMDAYRGSLAEVGAAYRSVFGKHFPAMALVAVTELVDTRAVVEVEATAVIPQAQPGGHPAIDLPTSKEQP